MKELRINNHYKQEKTQFQMVKEKEKSTSELWKNFEATKCKYCITVKEM